MAAPYAHLYRLQRWRKLALAVIERDGGVCAFPGCTNRATTADHVRPAAEMFAAGDLTGFFDPRNLRAACGSCNARAGAQLGVRLQRRAQRQTSEQLALAWSERENSYWQRVDRESRMAQRVAARRPAHAAPAGGRDDAADSAR